MNYQIKFTLFALLLSNMATAQYSINRSLFAKEYSKDECLFKSKNFVITEILGDYSVNVNKVEMESLTAANSGELTTVYYKSEDKNKEGLVLGFFGSRWNESGVVFTSYAFKNLTTEDAITVLNKLKDVTVENQKYLSEPGSNNERNLYFKYGDLSFIIYYDLVYKIRVLWNDFDVTWDYKSFEKTLKRFKKRVK
ncbi:MAG: hypothetical protein ABIP35_05020 [Ginsengibacter sp.]